jgi:hypothetical protein
MKNLFVDFLKWESEGTVWWILFCFFVFSSFLPLVLFLVLLLIRSLSFEMILGLELCFRNSLFNKLLFKLFCVCLTLGKLINRKRFSVKVKFGLVSRKVFSWKIWEENTFQKL